MSEPTTPAEFVHAFHRDLTRWFSGTGPRDEVWSRLEAATPDAMTLVYPSGARLGGRELLDGIRDRFGKSPGFEATIADVELLRADDDHAVVAYVESQAAATHSATRNRRSALALLESEDGAWRWRYIQETALPEAP